MGTMIEHVTERVENTLWHGQVGSILIHVEHMCEEDGLLGKKTCT